MGGKTEMDEIPIAIHINVTNGSSKWKPDQALDELICLSSA